MWNPRSSGPSLSPEGDAAATGPAPAKYRCHRPVSFLPANALMSQALRLLILAILLFVPACRRAAPPPAPAQPSWTPSPVQRLYYDNAGGIQDSLRLVVRDVAQLRSVWETATSRQVAPPPLPAIDFEREMVLVVAAGRRSVEDQIRVDSAGIQRTPVQGRSTLAEMTVVVRLSEGCRRFVTDAYPVELVRIRRFNGPVNWIERREQARGCGR